MNIPKPKNLQPIEVEILTTYRKPPATPPLLSSAALSSTSETT